MTIASEITRLQGAKSDARTSIINKGVDVPVNAKLDTYHNYIDLIQTGVPQEDYDLVVSLAKGAAIGYPDINYTAEHPGFGGNSYLCKIGNNIFMLGVYGRRYSSGNYDYFDSYLGIYYKLEGANSWSWCKVSLGQPSSNVYTSAEIKINNPVYISSDGSVNMNITVKAGGIATVYNQYKKWTIGTNTVVDSSQLTGEDLNNYKIYNSSISVWTIVPSDIYAVGYIIDDPLI